jgi:tRNA pseudouridine38-40 synthase
MPRYRLTLEYAGTRYSGWQIQKNAKTVQGELHRALQETLGKTPFETKGSGRTDAGVHALGQVVHVDTAATIPPATLVTRVNDALPADINVLTAERASPRFHARHSAVARSYIYQIARRRTAFAKPFVGGCATTNVDATEAARVDRLWRLQAFTDDIRGSRRRSWWRKRPSRRRALLLVRVTGSHFIWKMVRRIVGVLAEAGRGGLSATEVGQLLASESDLPPRLTAPSSGLFLERVFYEPPPANRPLTAPVVRIT